MSACVLLRLEGDDATYMVDLGAGSVIKVGGTADIAPVAGAEFTGLSFAVATERRDATATFPSFSD